MFSFKSLITLALAASVVVAQNPRIAFSSIPSVAVAGQSYNITWGGGDGVTPVTLTLRKGDPNNLETIDIIADRIRGNSYNWLVSTDLATGEDYALQITQGQSEINYSGSFSIVGGTGSVTLSFSGLTTTTSNSTVASSSMTLTSTGGVSMGTGIGMPRNTTFVSPTLPPATSTTTTTTSQRASTSTAPTTTASTPNAANTRGSSAAMVIGLFGAIMFLQ